MVSRLRLSLEPARISVVGWLHLAFGALVVVAMVVLHPREGDPLPFYATADKLASGLMAYRDVTSEYPPLALVHMTLPRLIGGASKDAYQNIFSAISLLLAIGTLIGVYWLARRRWAVEEPTEAAAMYVGLSLAAAPLVVWRFDILPAFFVTLAFVAYAAQRPGWAGLNLGLGSMAKIYPAFIAPVFAAAALFERRFRDAAVTLVATLMTVTLVLAGPILVAGTKSFSYVLYQENRGIEIESVMGGIAMLVHVVTGVPAKIAIGFGAWQIESSTIAATQVPATVFNAALVLLLLVCGAVSFRAEARELGSVQPSTLIRYTLATILVAILTNKVLSPQYLVWLLPLAALLRGRQSLLLLVIVLITIVNYPIAFQSLLAMRPSSVIALNIRNALLLGYFAWTVVPRPPVMIPRPRFLSGWQGQRA